MANELKSGKNSPSKTSSAPEVSKKDTQQEQVPTPSKTISAKELSTKDSATLVKEADDFFDKKSYSEAQVLYSELLNRNYKPAKINFNLGEIAYSQKSYSSAIED